MDISRASTTSSLRRHAEGWLSARKARLVVFHRPAVRRRRRRRSAAGERRRHPSRASLVDMRAQLAAAHAKVAEAEAVRREAAEAVAKVLRCCFQDGGEAAAHARHALELLSTPPVLTPGTPGTPAPTPSTPAATPTVRRPSAAPAAAAVAAVAVAAAGVLAESFCGSCSTADSVGEVTDDEVRLPRTRSLRRRTFGLLSVSVSGASLLEREDGADWERCALPSYRPRHMPPERTWEEERFARWAEEERRRRALQKQEDRYRADEDTTNEFEATTSLFFRREEESDDEYAMGWC